MESGEEGNFRPPDEPGPSFRSVGAQPHGGKRRGAGRKRQYDEGYQKARASTWKTIAIHKDVYDDWMSLREALDFKENSTFAKTLLQCARNANLAPGGKSSNPSESSSPTPASTSEQLGIGNPSEIERYFIWPYSVVLNRCVLIYCKCVVE